MSMSIQASTHAALQAQDPTRMSRRREAAAPEITDKADAQRQQVRPALAQAVSGALSDLMPDTETGAPTQRSNGTKALQEFTHELFQALRPSAGEDGPGRHGRGFAWGRTSLGDIAQRLDALAQQIGSATSTADAAPGATPIEAVASSTDALAAAADLPAAELPIEAPAATSTQTPPLLSAFQALTQQLGGDTSASEGATALATLLTRIAQALQADPAVTVSATGSLVDVTA
jgi:hypothetical protein